MSQTFHAHGQDWFIFTIGEGCPCNGDKKVFVCFKDGTDCGSSPMEAEWWEWDNPLPGEEIIGWRYADQPEAEPTERVPTTDDVQSAFEDWLASKCPSGDHDAVMRQWHESSEYRDLFRSEPTELEKTMKPKPRPTPESDKAAREGAYFQHGDYAETCGKQLVHLETARRLERERDEARDLLILCTNLKEVQSMAAELEQLQEENRLMRDAIKEAFDLLLDGENTRAGSTLQPFIKP